MVQVIKTENPQGKLSEMLGMSLGQGIGNGLNTYFANKSLKSVVDNPELKNAPFSKKLQELISAASPYGETGQQVLQNWLLAGQQEAQESEAKKQEILQMKKGQALSNYFGGKDLSEKESSLFSPAEFVAMHKAKNPKPSGGITAQPIRPEQINAIEQVIKQNPNATADELAIAMGKAGVEPIYSNPYIENRRRDIENKTNANAAETKIVNANDVKFHEESREYADSIRKEAKTAKQRLDTIKPIIEDVKAGKIKPTSWANIFRFFGNTGNKLADAVLSGKEANLLAAVPEFLEGRKELFGVRLSDADLKLLQDKLPDISKSKEANLQILNLMEKYANRALLRQEAAEKVIEEKGVQTKSGKLRPLNYENLVENEYDKILQEEENGVMMQLPDGRQVPIQRDKLKEAEKLGAKRMS